MGRWTNGFSDQWVVGPMGCRTIETTPVTSLLIDQPLATLQWAIIASISFNIARFDRMEKITSKLVITNQALRIHGMHNILTYYHKSNRVVLHVFH